MLQYLKTEANRTVTENGAGMFSTTGSDCLDFFSTAGALRHVSDSEIVNRFLRAYSEDKSIAMKILFYARDVRGKSVSLLAKWLPSVNASGERSVRYAKRLARHFGMKDAEYRRTLSSLRAHIRIIENSLRVRDYTFDYSAQPSRAMFKYRKAFLRNDETRYREFLGRVRRGEARLHADGVSPYELVEPFVSFSGRFSTDRFRSAEEMETINATWKSLPDFECTDNAIAVVDNSGSMYGWSNPSPASVALSLGMYFAEHNKGYYKDHFITFSRSPRLIEIKGASFIERLRYVMNFSEVANTNVSAVFDLILCTALMHRVPAEELPARIVIISDMEFDRCADHSSRTCFEVAREKFKHFGYRLPCVVFWNVASHSSNYPVRMDESGAILVSGFTPRLFSLVASGDVEPYRFMMRVVGSERYASIVA